MTELQELFEESEAPPRRGGLSLGSFVLLTGIVLVAIVIGLQLARQQQTRPESGRAPDFSLTMLDGQEITLSDLRGQIVVINFWASWCTPCREEAPDFELVWQQYRDQGVVVLGVAYTDVEREARAYIAEFNITYPNGLDVGTRISEDLYHITGVPETFVVDQNGDIAQVWPYPVDAQELSAVLDGLLVGDA